MVEVALAAWGQHQAGGDCCQHALSARLQGYGARGSADEATAGALVARVPLPVHAAGPLTLLSIAATIVYVFNCTIPVSLACFPAVVDFHRIWTDGGAITNGEGISIWRPAVAPGYASLGATRSAMPGL